LRKLNFAVIGAGAGGQSMAAILTEKGYRVRLYDIDEKKISCINALGKIAVTGKISACAMPDSVTADLAFAMEGADVVMITTTADAHEAVGKAIKPYIRDGQIIMLNPGQVGGALMMSQTIRSREDPPNVIIAEALDLMYACRVEDVGRIFHSGIKNSVLAATVPARDIAPFMEIMKPVFPSLTGADSVLYTSLDCGGAILHIIPTLMNINRMDSGESYDYYLEGITPHIAALLELADAERKEVCGVLRADLPSLLDWLKDCYHVEGDSLYEAIQKNDAYRGVSCPTDLKHRFISEEVLTGFVPMASIAREVGVKTPMIDSFIYIAQAFTGVDYWKEGRTAEKLGIAGKSVEEIRNYISK